MTVVKKDGSRETFSPEKLTKSIVQASLEAGEAVNEKNVLVEFYKVVESKTFITTHQIDIKERKKPAPFAKK